MVDPIRKSYVMPFPVHRVYRAWVSSDTVVPPATAVDVDPKIGGHFRLITETPEFNSRMEGTFSRVEPNEHLTYSWEWNEDGEVTEVDVTFDAHADGTAIGLTHSGFAREDSRAMHDSGWDSYVDGLIEHLSGR